MKPKRPEFSRIVPLAQLGSEPFRQEIAASEAEREALARRFDLLALDRLAAEVELVRQGTDSILLRASFEAAFVQSCVLTLEPVDGAMAANFTLRYGPPEAETPGPETQESSEDEPAFEPLVGDVIDIGEAVAQEFSLALPSFPRSPGAALEIDETPPDGGPFAALSRLADRQES
jgi:uncharacterized metal-binding protein YceD (DUF177 family)